MKSFANNTVAVFVFLIILLIIVPLPTPILDFMFILNLAISFVILFTTMYIKEALDFSIFPPLLLITTLLRLSLNISSTRNILSNKGYAGEVIRTFGEFVIGGNIVIGLVIFLIIVLVQFLVITKGSERVAEVAARFTLDAMPGKQMAIDADLSSGVIDDMQARERRLKIQREADFFGSMDGASKFVKGDAIMSIVVTVVNLIGGIVVGMIEKQGTIGQIMEVYSISTVGDGLMSQIPALLISVATGMIVTRSASEANLNKDVVSQFLSQPIVLILSGLALSTLSLIGFPIAPVLSVSILLIGSGIVIMRIQSQAITTEGEGGPGDLDELKPTQEVTSEVSYYKNIDNVYQLLNVEAIEMEFGYSLLPLADEHSGGTLLDRVVMFRKQFALEMGMVVPSVRLTDGAQLNPNQYLIKLRGEDVASGDVLMDHFLAFSPSDDDDDIDGIETIEPAFQLPAKWISQDKKQKAEMAGYTLIDPTSVIITHLSEVVRTHAHELLTRQEITNMLENLKKTNATIVNDTVPTVISVNILQKVISNLLSEQVSVKDLETILETLAEYGGAVKDTDMLTEYVRQALKRTITKRFTEAGQLKVVGLDAQIEDMIMASVKKVESGSYLALDPSTIQKIVMSTTQEIEKIKDLVQVPIILTSPIVRIYFKKLVDQFYPSAVVLSFNEIDNNIQIQALGNITL